MIYKRCASDPAYFINNFCTIQDKQKGEILPFHLWPIQAETVLRFKTSREFVALKARQIGFTWLFLALALHLMLFSEGKQVLLFSLRDDEAKDLLQRIIGMARRLPKWMYPTDNKRDSAHIWKLFNGSECRAFPTSAGDSYTAAFVLIDEADLVPDINQLLLRVKPTIDNGGKLALVSKSNKKTPNSDFKNIYRGAKGKQNDYVHIFAPWDAHPDRTLEWYERQKRDSIAQTGSLDGVYENYPRTDEEALAGYELDKRIAPDWLRQCLDIRDPIWCDISVPGFRCYELPRQERKYVIGADPAEGVERGDASCAVVLDEDGSEVGFLTGRIEPTVFAGYIAEIGKLYNNAGIIIERNNHGHAVIAICRDQGGNLLKGWDGKIGWLSNSRGKTELYRRAADSFRDKESAIRTYSAYRQLESIERSTLLAPPQMHDDEADAYALALTSLRLSSRDFRITSK